ncbi:glutathione S-transferase family protein [Sphingobium lignivorans]|uniref:Glutathione S-transferase n=1 Tax=Sphingobium lignivorans TaxID=2735886 RepID=A0ABR6NHU6_9SPHN|nr:glutathione S-transferase [Sphingobium lignivorans]MBB5986852.1 glutathione S-transferase [Sphingobium lignivorans]
MKLHWGKMSPFARKVMVTAHETGTDGRIELIDTRVDMASVNPQVQLANPLSKVPTLLLDDGTALYDSRVICEYLDSLAPEPVLFPQGAARWEALRLHALGDGIMDALILWRQERLKPEERRTPAWMDAFADKLAVALDQLEREAAQLSAAPFHIGHAALGCALGYLDARFDDLNWRNGHDRLADWHAGFEARPSAIATHPAALT